MRFACVMRQQIGQANGFQSIDLLCIAPLDAERRALLRHLPPAQQLPPDDEDVRIYYSISLPVELADGRRGAYQLIVTSPLAMGRVDAAILTNDALRRFRPRYVLLVGIAGGTPEKAALGDVLIADQFVDYEMQKLTDEGAQIRYRVHPADARLLGAAQHLSGWEHAVAVPRPEPGTPRCHVGTIASGDKVQAKTDSLGLYQEAWPQLIGVEMEAGGVASAAFQASQKPGVLMVRGVSDLADGHKNNAAVRAWREYAYEVAAAFAVALLRSGPLPFVDAK